MTRFTDKSNCTLKNYKLYTTNHLSGNSHGGTAIVIKANIKHHLIEEYKPKIQATSLKIQDRTTETAISAVYCSPRHTIKSFDFNNSFNRLGNRYICGGDWNAKHVFWGSRLTLTQGRQLYTVTNDLNLYCISHGVPTYWPSDPKKKGT